MMSRPFVSVVIPAYNSANYVGEAVQSVLAQTYRNFEIIVVDDGSTDETEKVLATYHNVSRYVKQRNAGAATARNHGIDLAHGEWVAFLDSDDIWRPDKLQKHVARIEERREPDCVCVFSAHFVFGDSEYTPNLSSNLPHVQFKDVLIAEPLVHPSAAIVRRDLPVRFHTWAEQGEDMLYFVELAEMGSFQFINECLAGYRKRSGSVTKKPGSATQSFATRRRWIEEFKSTSDPERAQRLMRILFTKLASEVELARWLRNWDRYRELRTYLNRHWPWPGEMPAVAREWTYPAFVYRLKDEVEKLGNTVQLRLRPWFSMDATHIH